MSNITSDIYSLLNQLYQKLALNSIILRGLSVINILLLTLCTGIVSAQVKPSASGTKDTVPALRYHYNDSRLPYQPTETPAGLNMKMPSNFNKTVEYDPITNEYIIKEKIGQIDYSLPYSMSIGDYQKMEARNARRTNWTTRRKNDKTTSRGSIIPKLNIGGETFDKIFGTNVINIVPQGSAELIFGLNTSKVNNPTISEQLRSTTTFDFQEKIQMNVTGSIGDKLKLGINYNTEATFDFENKTKLEYTGKEDEIIKKIEAGNVSLPLTGSLITGSQSLFGIKTELQFGKLKVTSVISQQKGQSSVIEVKGGAQVNEFEVPIDQYDANKHFFLSQFFRDQYEKSLENLPLVNSPFVITRVEVWVKNKTGNFTDSRNVVALMDLAEYKEFNTYSQFSSNVSSPSPPSNNVNKLYGEVLKNYTGRIIQTISNSFSVLADFQSSRDFEKLENAKKLTEREFTLNPKLGYISLNSALKPEDVLAVAYEYTYNNKTYQVGELSSTVSSPNALIVKLIKSANYSPGIPDWNLMMKNVYSINAYQVTNNNFRMDVVYHDDRTGSDVNYIPEKQGAFDASKFILLRKMGLDKLNASMDKTPDGYFDFIEGVTINAANGRIFFPTLEPFGSSLRNEYKDIIPSMIDKYVYEELYTQTQTSAKQLSNKNKFKLKGTYQSTVTSDIPLNATNIPQGSVVVTAGGRQLVENVDYTVDYTLGRLKIINQGLLESKADIHVSLESNSLFNMQTKTMLGTHLEYKFSDNLSIGATAINLTERPLTQKVNIGDEPVSNTMLGLNGTYTTKSQFITNMLDKIPLLSLKEPSTVTIDGEFADLIPGTSSAIKNSSYIDDFEGSETTIDLKAQQSWFLASTPLLFPEATLSNNLLYGAHRAKLAWYVIDPIFYKETMSSNTPANIKGDDNTRSSNYVRNIPETEIFKGRQSQLGANITSNLQVLNLAYYPREKGPYNYNTNPSEVKADGTLANPQREWGGIQREIVTSDFETANVEFIQFWMMDPFLEDKPGRTGGSLYFNLGDVSEDVLKDSRKSFENGLPTQANDSVRVDTTAWGLVSKSQSLVNSFETDPAARTLQDVGLDGLNNGNEQTFFHTYLDSLRKVVSTDNIGKYIADPSSDDFHYYRDSIYDRRKAGILERYKNFNNPDKNSPVITSATGQSFSGTSLPNTEDINHDNTLNETESYFQYKVDISPQGFKKLGSNYIVDSVVNNTIKLDNGKTTSAVWYQFRIPINDENKKAYGSIQNFQSIHFMRMFMAGFDDSIIMRLAALELVRGEWRKSDLSFKQGGEVISTPNDDDASFNISAVNIENNAQKQPVNYVLPPGITRQVDPQNPQLRQLNEQAMVLKVNNLVNGDARAAYKNLTLDIRQYKHLIMDVHAEALPHELLEDNELTLFLRVGSDYKNNFYEYEVPLQLTKPGIYNDNLDNDKYIVWPDSNRLDFDLEDFQTIKQLRNSDMQVNNTTISLTTIYKQILNGKKGSYSVCGNPNLSNVRTIMIGIRYPHNSHKSGQTRSAEVWVNELRLTQFNEQGGWAANLRATTKLSDLGNLTLSGSIITPGFGSIEKKVSQRAKEETTIFNVATNLELGKFFPQKLKIQIPMYASYSQTTITPQYNPLDPDIELKTSLKTLKSDSAKKALKNMVLDVTTQKSLNFTNVRINKKGANSHIYDISNVSVSYSYNETDKHDINTDHSEDKRYHGGLIYSYQPKPKSISPLTKVSFLKNNALRLVRDFNFQPYPNSFSFRTDMDRTYSELINRDLTNPSFINTPSVRKDFLWNRSYEMSWDLARSLKFDINASNYARIDEPYGTNDGMIHKRFKNDYQHWKDSIWSNIKNGGRPIHYQHTLNVTYTLPINKLPLLDWTSSSIHYNATYDWAAAPIKLRDTIGNTISNSYALQFNGQLTFTTLYNKIPYFKKLLQVQDPKKKQKKYKTVNYTREKTFLAANQPKVILHKLATLDITIKVLDSEGKEVKGTVDIVNPNRATFTADKDYSGVKILVDGKIEEKENPLIFIVENFTRMVLGVKSFSIAYTQNGGTTLPGYFPNSKILGLEELSSKSAPGLPFIVGLQNNYIARDALDNGWMIKGNTITNPINMAYTTNLNLRSNIEPITGLKIELNATRSFAQNQSAYLDHDAAATYGYSNPVRMGSYSISFLSIGSAFEKPTSANNFASKAFEDFKKNRSHISTRLGKEYGSYLNGRVPGGYTNTPNEDKNSDGFGLTSQNVLIPAFMAAYGNKSTDKVSLEKFPAFKEMMPNWRATYDGLSKIPILAKYVKTINLSHLYRSTYSVGSYIASPDSIHIYSLDEELSTIRDIQNNWLPGVDIQGVSITEQFGPLVGIDIGFKNSLSTKFEYKKSRNIALSMANNQIIETLNNELVIGAGYKISDLSLIIKSAVGQKGYKTNMNFRADLSIRDNKTIIRPLAEDQIVQASQGQKIVSLKLSADYVLSDSFNIRMFFDRIVNTPLVSSSYPTANTNIGISVRFTLTK